MATRKNTLAMRAGARITVAAVAGAFVGLLLSAAVAASILFAPLQPGYEDYGLRHRVQAPVTVIEPTGDRLDDYGLRHPVQARVMVIQPTGDRLDDYGLRCRAVGWCTQPGSAN